MSLARLLFRELLRGPRTIEGPLPDPLGIEQLGRALGERARAGLGRSLRIREVDAGSCNGCELEIQAVNGPVYDLERFGIHFVASPRHADVLLVTGPVSRNMAEALRRTYDAMPSPKWVVAMGDCAADGGCFAGGYAVLGGVHHLLPVDLTIPGCPPTPLNLLSGLLALLEVAAVGSDGQASGA
ncbi:NADH-quinone oxidoreductase subunit B family protein [Telmatospirillum siberiense]|uniref:Hydrogenase n=1 Tax=Telmatospirillum siberiense TaxID=382514 RepID=A0A2N3Q0I3_9PROT|nr:NADH-quinone oxidoreductase subunit NuoB [Telmatospirillum siberiense]PKU26169.1 hydrogenase [Telmatospirillum siberiense]